MVSLKMGDPTLKKTLEMSIELGKPVMVTNIGETVTPVMYSLLKKETFMHNGVQMIKFYRKTFRLDPDFKLFLLTNAQAPHFDVNITNAATLVNFFVT